MIIKNKNVLITGGAGFIGSHLVNALVNKSNSVKILDNFSSGTLDNIEETNRKKIEVINGDIQKIDDLELACKDVDIIFHYAADPDVRSSVKRPINNFNINVRGTLNILEVMRKNDVPNIVFASSGGTLYGDVDINEIPTSEKHGFKPISPYGASKAAVEVYLSAYSASYGMNTISVRFANVYGPNSTHGVMFDFYNKLKRNPKELEILGNGMQEKSYLYISDCIEATIIATEKCNKGYDVYNLGTEIPITVNKVARLIINELQLKNVKLKYTGGTRGWTGDVIKSLLSIEKIKKLGWTPKIPIEKGIHLYVEWLKKRFN